MKTCFATNFGLVLDLSSCHSQKTRSIVACVSVSLSARNLKASRRYCNESGRYFRIYLIEIWADLRQNLAEGGKWGNSDPVNFVARSLQKPQRKRQNTNLLFIQTGALKMRDWKMRDWKIREQETYGTPRVA